MKRETEPAMIMKTEHSIGEDGQHRIAIDGLRVWIFKDGDMWVAHGIDIDYVVSGETAAQAQEAFGFGLSMTLAENIRRFGSIERFISKRAPRDIEECWLAERSKLKDETVPLRMSQAIGAPQEEFGVPPQVHYFKEQRAA